MGDSLCAAFCRRPDEDVRKVDEEKKTEEEFEAEAETAAPEAPEEVVEILPVMPMRGITVFPNMTVTFDVGRKLSVRAVDAAMASGKSIFLVAQRDMASENPKEQELYTMGTVAGIKQILRLQDGSVRALVRGLCRGRLRNLTQTDPYYMGEVEHVPEEKDKEPSTRDETLMRMVYKVFDEYTNLAPTMGADAYIAILASRNPGYIADYLAQNLPLRNEEKQKILLQTSPRRRLEEMYRLLQRETEILRMEERLQSRLHVSLSKDQKNYYLREQMKAIQSELGEEESAVQERYEYRKKIIATHMPKPAMEKLFREVDRMLRQPYGSADGAVMRNYVDTCLELPWEKRSRERLDVDIARKTLDADHFGLEKVKERVLEFLAVRKLAPDLKGQVLCLVGPPGVGKTSIGMSIARALNRKLARISLGGVHDEAEIRGHRKTYIGSMPGRIINAMIQAGTKNPVLLLDEIDKLGSDYRGDPYSALLEVLDGEQNSTFRDNYIEMPFDLSEVMFITTANTTSTIPRPLLDRMEVIEMPGYTDEEKVQIAKRHLMRRQLKRHGLKAGQLKVTDDAIREIIACYTRESGVRVLERQLAAICRKAAMKVVAGETRLQRVTPDQVEQYLGVRKYHPETQVLDERIGVVNGLAWTAEGGELLEVEVNVVPGTGKVEMTGNLGDVLKESAQAALSCIRSRTGQLGIEEDFYKTRDVHVHFPEGAVPKDGPSAGVAIATAMVSALTNTPVTPGIAMTGEITLRGRVLPIGGLREKTMAALRNGIHTVIIPQDNVKDLEEIDQTVREALEFFPAGSVDQVLSVSLLRGQQPPIESAKAFAGQGKQSRQRTVPLRQ